MMCICSGDYPYLCLWSLPSYLPLEYCYQSPSSERSESCDVLSARAHHCWVSFANGLQAVDFAVIDTTAGRPASPGNFLGWALMRS